MSSMPEKNAHPALPSNRPDSAYLRGPAPQALLLLRPGLVRERLVRQLGQRWPVVEIGCWAAVPEALQEHAPVALLLVDPYADGQGKLHPALESICISYPSIPVVAVVETSAERVRDIFRLGHAGVAEIVDPLAGERADVLLQRLQEVTELPFRRRMHPELLQLLPAQAEALMTAAIRTCSANGGVAALAASLFVSELALLRWTSRVGLPPPRELLKWIRVLWAAALLEDTSRRVLDVAWCVGYAGDGALRRAFRDYLGISPSAMRDWGIWSRAIAAFRERLESNR
jgi:AraC-like DNA-binding protein